MKIWLPIWITTCGLGDLVLCSATWTIRLFSKPHNPETNYIYWFHNEDKHWEEETEEKCPCCGTVKPPRAKHTSQGQGHINTKTGIKEMDETFWDTKRRQRKITIVSSVANQPKNPLEKVSLKTEKE